MIDSVITAGQIPTLLPMIPRTKRATGRELAYVALSRARIATALHAVADDLDQVRHDLGLDWSNDRHQRWITDGAEIDTTEAVGDVTALDDVSDDRQRLRQLLDALQDRPGRHVDDDIGLGL